MLDNPILPLKKNDDETHGIIQPIDYSMSTAMLTQSIQMQYPQLNTNEVEILGNSVLQEVSRRISEGEKLAFFSKDDAGNATLTLIGFEVVENNSQPQNLLGNLSKNPNG